MKIIYTAIRKENYDPRRGFSFEHNNFFLTLSKIKGIELIEYPFDPIIEKGKGAFNRELLALVRKERPDAFFAFMLSDELDGGTLLEIKKLTTSIAWFSDDSWRIYNYSRYWPQYFTWIVTTYSWAPDMYRRFGHTNVIRSQWGCNPDVWKPVDVAQDIGVSFVGQYNPGRAETIEKLRGAGIPIEVRGWGWAEGRLSQGDMIPFISRSKINININSQPPRFALKSLGRLFLKRSGGAIVPDFHLLNNFRSWLHITDPQVKARPFELAACRAFVISGYGDDLASFYKEDEEMVFYRTTDELIEKIKYYLPRDSERERIAEAGYRRTLRDHTYEHRLRNIFRLIFPDAD